MACSPADLLPLRFGDDSFYPHLDRARALGVEPRIIERSGFALDVDTPEDLEALRASGIDCDAARYLSAIAHPGFASPR